MEKVQSIFDLVTPNNQAEFSGEFLSESQDNLFSSPNFSTKSNFLKTLFGLEKFDASNESTSIDAEDLSNDLLFTESETIYFSKWKNFENVSARLINVYEDTVVLECLIDKENSIYEEREFHSILFSGYDLTIGNLFLLRFFERPNEMRLEVHSDPDLVLKSDFPKMDFKDIFEKSKLFK